MSSTKTRFIVLAIAVLTIIVGGVIMRNIFPSALSQQATEKDFLKNKDNIILLTNYLITLQYDELSIRMDDSATMFANTHGNIAIDDPQIVGAIDTLISNGYKAIVRDGNTINFLHSSPTRDFGSGVAYSIDGSEPQLQLLTKLVPLAEPNWYYYEEDFNEYKKNR